MIRQFFPIVQKDLSTLLNYVTNESFRNANSQEERIALAVTRMLGTLSMISGPLVAVLGVTIIASNPIGAVLTVALGVGLYALGHDIFVMARNRNDLLDPVVLRTGKLVLQAVRSQASNFINNWQQGESLQFDPQPIITEGTFFKPLWNIIIPKLLQN